LSVRAISGQYRAVIDEECNAEGVLDKENTRNNETIVRGSKALIQIWDDIETLARQSDDSVVAALRFQLAYQWRL